MTNRPIAFQKALKHLEQYKNEEKENEIEKNELILSLKNLSLDNLIKLSKTNTYHRISLFFLIMYFFIIFVLILVILIFLILNSILGIKNMILVFCKKKKPNDEIIQNVSSCTDNHKISDTNMDFKLELEKVILNKKKQNIIFRRSSGSIRLSSEPADIQQKNTAASNKKTL